MNSLTVREIINKFAELSGDWLVKHEYDNDFPEIATIKFVGEAYSAGYECCITVYCDSVSLNGSRSHRIFDERDLEFALRDLSQFAKSPSPEEESEMLRAEIATLKASESTNYYE